MMSSHILMCIYCLSCMIVCGLITGPMISQTQDVTEDAVTNRTSIPAGQLFVRCHVIVVVFNELSCLVQMFVCACLSRLHGGVY